MEEKCIASWIIKKVINEENTNKCWNFIEFKINDWINNYLINWNLSNSIEDDSILCNSFQYQLKNLDIIKEWLKVYVIADNNSNQIIEISDKDIVSNLNINKCSEHHYYSLTDYLYKIRWYENCKIKWKTDYVKYVENPDWYNCYFDINLQISNENWKYFISTKEHFLYDKSWFYICLWSTDTIFPIEKNINWENKVFQLPKIWEESYFIINNETKELIWYWEDEYLNSTLSECSIDIEKQSFSLTWWLSKNELTQKRIDAVLWMKKEKQNQNSINPVLEQNQINTNIDMENEYKIDNNDIKIETKPIKDYKKDIDTIDKIVDIKKNEDTKISQDNQDNSITGTITSTWIIKHEEVIQDIKLNKEINHNYLFWIGVISLIILWLVIYRKFKK